MVDEILKMVGGFLISRGIAKEIEEWSEYRRNPNEENYMKALEISYESWNLFSLGVLLFLIGWIISKKSTTTSSKKNDIS